jgi:hypothetical protein
MSLQTCLNGGLGNRLFQYASVKALAIKYNLDFKIYSIDTNSAHNYNTYDWILKKIKLKYYEIPRNYNNPNLTVWCQPENQHLGYHEPPISDIKNCVLDGYFQSEKYFENISDELREDFKEPPEITPHIDRYIDYLQSKEIIIENICIIHMRLKDKLGDPRHFVNYTKYYKKTIDRVLENNKNTVFLILSETPEQINHIYPTVLPYIIDNNSNYIIVPRTIINPIDCFDFYLITRIKTIISTCSTFVWWAAWLNSNPEKQVYLPSHFLNDPVNHRVDMAGAYIIDVN